MPKRYIFCLILLVLIIIILVGSLPVFNVKEFIITGNDLVAREEIYKLINLDITKNIFLFNKKLARKKLIANNFIESVKINFILPDKIHVAIQEKEPCCYIKSNKIYLLLDKNFYVLEQTKTYNKKFPVAINLTSSDLILDGKLFISKANKKKFNITAQLASNIIKNNLYDFYIKSCDKNNLCISTRNINIKLGSLDNLNSKLKTLRAILDSKSVYLNKPGILNLTDYPPVFKLLI